MNENNQNFDELQRLLKLKRHEVPPPGYFNNFSDQIISRIQAGEAVELATKPSRLQVEAPWLVRFLAYFEASPAIVGGFATSLCLMLVLGVVLAERPESAPQSIFTPTALNSSSLSSSDAASVAALTPGSSQSSGIAISTNPATSLQPVATLFGQPDAGSPFQTAGFSTGGN
jgi:hypothetical protein